MRTRVIVTCCRRGSPASRSNQPASSDCTRCATRSGRRSAMAVSSVVEELEPLRAQLGHPELLDELDDVTETAVDVLAIGAHLAHPEDGALPEIVLLALRDRHVELVLHARVDRAEHAPLALERVVLGQQQLQAEYPDDHGSAGARSGRALCRLGALGAGRCPEAASHLLDIVGFDDIAHLQILVALEREPAFVAARDFACVLLAASEAGEAAPLHYPP